MLLTLIRRDLNLFLFREAEAFGSFGFFLISLTLFGIALGATPDVLQATGPAVLWILVALSSLLSLETLWQRDIEDGRLDLLLLSTGRPLLLTVAKMLAHWLGSGVLLSVLAALLSPLLFIPLAIVPIVFCALCLGTAYLSVLGGFGAVLTAGARRPGVLTVFLILPLFLPMLILGLMTTQNTGALNGAIAGLALQAALVLAALPLGVWGTGKCLEMQVRT